MSVASFKERRRREEYARQSKRYLQHIGDRGEREIL
jgi:hypothetical protein